MAHLDCLVDSLMTFENPLKTLRAFQERNTLSTVPLSARVCVYLSSIILFGHAVNFLDKYILLHHVSAEQWIISYW